MCTTITPRINGTTFFSQFICYHHRQKGTGTECSGVQYVFGYWCFYVIIIWSHRQIKWRDILKFIKTPLLLYNCIFRDSIHNIIRRGPGDDNDSSILYGLTLKYLFILFYVLFVTAVPCDEKNNDIITYNCTEIMFIHSSFGTNTSKKEGCLVAICFRWLLIYPAKLTNHHDFLCD